MSASFTGVKNIARLQLNRALESLREVSADMNNVNQQLSSIYRESNVHNYEQSFPQTPVTDYILTREQIQIAANEPFGLNVDIPELCPVPPAYHNPEYYDPPPPNGYFQLLGDLRDTAGHDVSFQLGIIDDILDTLDLKNIGDSRVLTFNLANYPARHDFNIGLFGRGTHTEGTTLENDTIQFLTIVGSDTTADVFNIANRISRLVTKFLFTKIGESQLRMMNLNHNY